MSMNVRKSKLISVLTGLPRLGGLLLDALLPPRCLVCGAMVGDQGGLCPVCWSQLSFVSDPLCACCGLPLPFAPAGDDAAQETLCQECVEAPPPFRHARAALVYDAASRPLVLGFKHADRLHAAGAFAAWMLRAGGPLLAETDLLVPAPLHPWRLFSRRYNQAAVLALAVGRLAGRPTAVDALLRRRATVSQGHMGRAERRRNVAGAFAVAPQWAGRLVGRRVLLVDDVMTTGATAGACARALLAGGAAAVDVLTLARAVRG